MRRLVTLLVRPPCSPDRGRGGYSGGWLEVGHYLVRGQRLVQVQARGGSHLLGGVQGTADAPARRHLEAGARSVHQGVQQHPGVGAGDEDIRYGPSTCRPVWEIACFFFPVGKLLIFFPWEIAGRVINPL